MKNFTTDIIIIGGGIAGLWLHHRLNDMGYHALLIEKHAIGHGQTLSSQGIIHGGAKYTLNGMLSNAASAISGMPQRWLDCIAGNGDIDLSSTTLLSQHQFMWSTQGISSKLTSFFSSKALNGKIKPLDKVAYPDLFNNSEFRGYLYQLNEPVLDIPSLLNNLSKKWQQRIICTEKPYTFIHTSSGSIDSMTIDGDINICTKAVILSSGEGNESLLEQCRITSPKMQRRPLQMVLAKRKNLPKIYAHCIGASTKPIATITSHTHQDGDDIWYIGGNIAENGVNDSNEDLIKHTHKTLRKILPWLDISNIQWATHHVNRAEPAQKNMLRPDTAFLTSSKNIYITWPTKLALTPNLADQLIEQFSADAITPLNGDTKNQDTALALINERYSMKLSPSLWDRAFNANN